jgi:hypothetical protein
MTMPHIESDHATLDRVQGAGHRAYVLSDLADSEARGDLGRCRVLRQILDQEAHAGISPVARRRLAAAGSEEEPGALLFDSPPYLREGEANP